MKKAEVLEVYSRGSVAMTCMDAAADPEKAAAVSRLLAVLQFAVGAHALLEEIRRLFDEGGSVPVELMQRIERALA